MKAIRLKTEFLFEPVGIDIDRPRLFWNCQGGARQTAYEIAATAEDWPHPVGERPCGKPIHAGALGRQAGPSPHPGYVERAPMG